MTIYKQREGGIWVYRWYSQDEGGNIYFKDEAAALRAIKQNGSGKIVLVN